MELLKNESWKLFFLILGPVIAGLVLKLAAALSHDPIFELLAQLCTVIFVCTFVYRHYQMVYE